MPHPIHCHDLGFTWPDGDQVLTGLTATFPDRLSGLTGLIGRNGSGKSTLLWILAGQLTPTTGSVQIAEHVGYLPQDVTLDPDLTLGQALGIAPLLDALHRVDAGRPELTDFDLLADRWDVADRARAVLDRLGFDPGLDLDRRLVSVSGGEATLLAVAALLLDEPAVLLLDEPTNNLDAAARGRLRTALTTWTRPAVVVTHDRELLAVVDQIAELRPTVRTRTFTHRSPSTLRLFGGAFPAYLDALAAEDATARRDVRVAAQRVRTEHREMADLRTALDHRLRTAGTAYREKREPRIVMRARQRTAQVSAATITDRHLDDLAEAESALAEAEDRVRDDAVIRIDLSHTAIPGGRDVLDTTDLVLRTGLAVELRLRGPERVGLVGPNGSGKTTLIDTLTGAIPPRSGSARIRVPYRVLPQRLRLLPDDTTVLTAIRTVAPELDDTTVRSRLALFLLAGDTVHRPVGSLSGGERFRATLASLLLAAPAAQLLILDEPTNNLDLDSVAQLVAALDAYAGALLVVSHDRSFLEEIGLTRTVDLSAAP